LFSVVLWPEVKQVAMVVLTTPLFYVKLNTQQHWRTICNRY